MDIAKRDQQKQQKKKNAVTCEPSQAITISLSLFVQMRMRGDDETRERELLSSRRSLIAWLMMRRKEREQ